MVTQEYNYDRVLDAVADLGCDPTGRDRIDSRVVGAARDGTLIVFPDGTYRSGTLSFPSGLRRFGLVGADGSTPTFSYADSGGDWLNFDGGRRIQVENIVFQTNDNGGQINLDMPGPFVARDLTKQGFHPNGSGPFRARVEDSGAVGLMERCEARHVNPIPVPDGGTVGIWINKNHAGDLIIRDCVMTECEGSGIYGSAPYRGNNGAVMVERGLYKNCNRSGVRLGSDGSYARGVVVVQDGPAPVDGGAVQRGIWIREAGQNIDVHNCDITIGSGVSGDGAGINKGSGASGGSGSITDTRIRQDNGSPAMNIASTSGFSGSGTHLTGSGNLDAPDAWVACRGDGCDEPRTTQRATNGDGGGGGNGDGGGGGGGDGTTAPELSTADWLILAFGVGAGLAVLRKM